MEGGYPPYGRDELDTDLTYPLKELPELAVTSSPVSTPTVTPAASTYETASGDEVEDGDEDSETQEAARKTVRLRGTSRPRVL